MKYEYNKLRGRIVEKYKSQRAFAKAYGISENLMTRKMTGRTGISQIDIKKWCELLDIKTEEIGEYFFT